MENSTSSFDQRGIPPQNLESHLNKFWRVLSKDKNGPHSEDKDINCKGHEKDAMSSLCQEQVCVKFKRD